MSRYQHTVAWAVLEALLEEVCLCVSCIRLSDGMAVLLEALLEEVCLCVSVLVLAWHGLYLEALLEEVCLCVSVFSTHRWCMGSIWSPPWRSLLLCHCLRLSTWWHGQYLEALLEEVCILCLGISTRVGWAVFRSPPWRSLLMCHWSQHTRWHGLC